MYQWYCADFHVHTVLSPCAQLDMGPKGIVATAQEMGLDIIAITDHNACENVGAVMEQARKMGGPVVIPGMEIQTKEEVHLVCLFPKLELLQDFGSYVDEILPKIPNEPAVFGEQVVVNGNEDILGFVDHVLTTSCGAALEEVVAQVISRGGIVIPAHVDRPSFSILANLGFIPASLPVTALEIAFPQRLEGFLGKTPHIAGYNLVTSSDAHCLDQWRQWEYRSYCFIREPSFSELCLALRGEGQRKVVVGLQKDR